MTTPPHEPRHSPPAASVPSPSASPSGGGQGWYLAADPDARDDQDRGWALVPLDEYEPDRIFPGVLLDAGDPQAQQVVQVTGVELIEAHSDHRPLVLVTFRPLSELPHGPASQTTSPPGRTVAAPTTGPPTEASVVSRTPMGCEHCGSANSRPGSEAMVVQEGDRVAVVTDVPVHQCLECGATRADTSTLVRVAVLFQTMLRASTTARRRYTPTDPAGPGEEP